MTSEYHFVLNKSSINRCKALYKKKKKTVTFSVEFRASQPIAVLAEREIQEGVLGVLAEGTKTT